MTTTSLATLKAIRHIWRRCWSEMPGSTGFRAPRRLMPYVRGVPDPLDPSFDQSQRSGAIREVDLEAEIAKRVPNLHDAITIAVESQIVLASQVLSSARFDLATKIIVSQAINDLLDLLAACQEGLGRSAIRTSRALVEHAINLHTVRGDAEHASRYSDHLHWGNVLIADLAPGADLLPKKQRGALRHRLAKRRRSSSAALETAIGKYGSAFRRSWASKNLSDRADEHDLKDLYKFYRFASLVTHGSAGGAIGGARLDDEYNRIFRTGQSIELAPIALWGGLRAYLQVLTALNDDDAGFNCDEYFGSFGPLMREWPDFFTATDKIDKLMWPDGPVRGSSAVFVLRANGVRTWYLFAPSMNALLPAQAPPALEQWLESELDQLCEHQITSGALRRGGGSIAVEVKDVIVSPDPSARAIPADAFLFVPKESGSGK